MTRLGQLGAADEQVGQVRVGLVVDERRAVEPGHVQPGGRGHGDRARPSPTRTGRRRGRRRRRRRARPPWPWRRPSPAAPARRRARRRCSVAAAGGPAAAHDDAGRPVAAPAAAAGRVAVDSVSPRAGRATAPATGHAADDEGDVHGPVGAGDLAELAGAVERVDDPHPVGGEPGRVGGALLGEHGVVGPGRGQAGDEQLVGLPVALVAQGLPSTGRPAVGRRPRPAASTSSSPGLGGEPGGEGVVVGRIAPGRGSVEPWSIATTPVGIAYQLVGFSLVGPCRAPTSTTDPRPSTTYELSHLRALEAESIHIIREVAAEFERPGAAVLGRQGLDRHAAPGRQGVLARPGCRSR